MIRFIQALRRFNPFRIFRRDIVITQRDEKRALESNTLKPDVLRTSARAQLTEQAHALENTPHTKLATSNLNLAKGEQSFDIVSNQVNKLATVAQGLAKNSRRLGMFSAVSALWLWFYSFRGVIASWSWLANASLVLLALFLIPSILVFCLYFILRQGANLPNSFREMKQDLLNSDDGALGLFAQKNSKHALLASWKVFGVIRNFRELLQTFPTLFSQYKSVLTLSNPLLAALLGGSVAACVLINALALLTFGIWLIGRF